MKHLHLRKEKNCLNCGKHVTDRFCSHCGQENTEPIESFGHLLNHFFADVTHWDSQFLTTIKYLLFKPGFLTKQYNAGKRLSYLNPIRMYIFISAIFFLLVFSGKEEKNEDDIKTATLTYKQHLSDSLAKLSKVSKDTVRKTVYSQLASGFNTNKPKKDTTEIIGVAADNHGNVVFHIIENKYSNLKEYDNRQKKLADTAKDDFFSRYLAKKTIRLYLEKGQREITIKQNVAHDIPKVMFILLPLFALLVALLYSFYNKKKYLYSQHAIFSLHFHSYVFSIFILLYFVAQLSFISLIAGSIIVVLAMLWVFFYLAFALHSVYEQNLWLSILKAFAISFCYMITVIICQCIVFVVAFTMI